MDRLLERSLEILAAASPQTLPVDRLSRALHGERMAVTEGILERSLAATEHVRLIDPWLGANRAVARVRGRSAGRRRWVCMTPVRTEWAAQKRADETSTSAPSTGPGTSPSRGPVARIDRAVRTVSDRIDLESPVELARWIRLCGEGTRAGELAA